jgi:hypothetical protein
MDNLFEDSDDSEGTNAGPDIDKIPEDNEIPDDEEEEEIAEENKEGGYSPVVSCPEVDW